MSTPLQARRSTILAAIAAMPPAFNPTRNRLELVTRAFLDLSLFTDAVMFGWTDRELFSVDPARCAYRPDRAGLISGVALSALNGPKVLSIGAREAVIECGTKANRSLLTHRRVPADHLGVCWWHSPELGARLSDQAQEIAA